MHWPFAFEQTETASIGGLRLADGTPNPNLIWEMEYLDTWKEMCKLVEQVSKRLICGTATNHIHFTRTLRYADTPNHAPAYTICHRMQAFFCCAPLQSAWKFLRVSIFLLMRCGLPGVVVLWTDAAACVQGKVKAIGVSNFTEKQIQAILDGDSGVCPAVNQVELHPYLAQPELTSFCKERGIVMMGYSPLG